MKPGTEQIRILILSDHAIFRYGLRCLLESEPDFNVVAEARDGDQAVNLVLELKPEILLIDMRSLQPNAEIFDLQTLDRCASKESDARPILLLAPHDEVQVVEALKLGARGVIRKEAGGALLFKCIRSVMEGGYWISRSTTCELVRNLESLTNQLEQRARLLNWHLSERELEVIKGVVSGFSNKDIAQELGISEQAVKYHLTNIYGKTKMSGRMELVRFVISHRLL